MLNTNEKDKKLRYYNNIIEQIQLKIFIQIVANYHISYACLQCGIKLKLAEIINNKELNAFLISTNEKYLNKEEKEGRLCKTTLFDLVVTSF